MRNTVLFLLAVMCLALGVVAQSSPVVDFEACVPGESVEGLGTVHPYLDIQTLGDGLAVCLETGEPPAVFGATNEDLVLNNCLENELGQRVDASTTLLHTRGFGDSVRQAAGEPQEFQFSFKPGVTVTSFGIRMFDFGDYNPDLSTDHHVSLTGYDSGGHLLGSDDLNYSSDGQVNPRSGSAGDLWESGDACEAELGEPGYHEFSIVDSGISELTLTVGSGHDPNVAFDSIHFTLAAHMDLKFCSYTCLRRNGRVPVTLFGGGADGFDVADVDLDTVRLCRADELTSCTSPPTHWTYLDAGGPEALDNGHCLGSLVRDGNEDLVLRFIAAEVTSLIGCPDLEPGESSPDVVLVGEIAGAPFISNADFMTIIAAASPPRSRAR